MTSNYANEAAIIDSTFENANLGADAAVRELVAAQQEAYQATHGVSAIALMVARGYIAIRQIITNGSPEVRAAILDEHGIAPAAEGTSIYTPWIKAQWGERAFDTSKTFLDSEGTKRVRWEPNRSMEIYHHTMEELQELGVATLDPAKVAEVIMKNGGPSAMARARQKAIRDRQKPAKEQKAQIKRDLLLTEANGPVINPALDVPEDAGDYMTLLVRKSGDGWEVLGIANAKANAALDAVADAQFGALTRKREDREREARFQSALNKAGADREARILSFLSPEQREALKVQMTRKAETIAAA